MIVTVGSVIRVDDGDRLITRDSDSPGVIIVRSKIGGSAIQLVVHVTEIDKFYAAMVEARDANVERKKEVK